MLNGKLSLLIDSEKYLFSPSKPSEEFRSDITLLIQQEPAIELEC